VGFTRLVTASLRTIATALLAALALAAPASASQVLQYDGHGRLTPRNLRALPPPSGPEAAVAGREQACGAPQRQPKPRVGAAGPSVKQAIAAAERRGSISAAKARSYRAVYRKARRTRKRLSRYRSELSSVISVLQGIARRGKLTGSRMPALFLQLRRNTEFWGGDPTFPERTDIPSEPCTPRPPGTSSGAGARITFEGSRLVFQYYPGAGLQIQPLANFGLANGLRKHCFREPDDCDRAGLRKLLDELVAIRSRRGGFTTWEYWFYFGGGTPPWTSGMSQGTAIQALARASKPNVLDRPSYLKVARSALGAFLKPPPVGVRVKTDGGSHYLLYSFSPGERVLNGFLQSITGIFDYAEIAHSSLARRIWRRGDRAARAELSRFDTGAWSLYSQGGAEASLGYHELVTGFLDNLCDRIHGRYCTYAKRFGGYLKTPPRLRYSGHESVRKGRTLSLAYSVDKVSCVTARIYSASGKRVYRARSKVTRGGHAFGWAPRKRGRYKLKLQALDPARNKAAVTRSLRVR
jgi:hypothetical protein